jgi:ATP-dependent exoDNAse (exonuclease V) beta subunit
MTRARRALILPWGEAMEQGSFLDLWGAEPAGLPRVTEARFSVPDGRPESADAALAEIVPAPGGRQINFPQRLLPHQLAHKPDAMRVARHESASDEPTPSDREDPIEYGLWWHETMEFLPWRGTAKEQCVHFEAALAGAEKKGFVARAKQEIELLRASELWCDLRSERWRILTELSVLAPMGEARWVDGIIDLVAHDQAAGRLLLIDWKTNRVREGEKDEDVIRRLTEEYRPQLTAYGTCLAQFFPEQAIQFGVYASGVGKCGKF